MMKIENMFFEFKCVKTEGEPFEISSHSKLVSDTETYAFGYAQDVLAECSENGNKMTVSLVLDITEDIRTKAGNYFSDDEESYAVEITDNEIKLCSKTEGGLIFAVSTLKQLVESGNIRKMFIFDYPDKKVRGYRVFTPGRKSFDAFKKMVDMLVYYKYNHIMIEIGGAMEYKRHPEINAKWVEFCKEVHKGPNEAERIQKKTHPQWQKNSIHADNGDGEFITQAEMRELIGYCRERGISVIPEVPSLSHCDYIVMAHPDIREREEDTYPDTYCPSNPKSYQIMFDVFDEIIEVFQPQYINIGHDECYTLAKCPKCKDKDPVDLYVGDIEKINNYLKTKNIISIMWAEKFFDNVYLPDNDGVLHGYGGTGDALWDVPRCIGCVGKVPKDVILLHWYWSLCTGKEEQDIRALGYEMLFGNFRASALSDYRTRSNEVSGGFVSNWGSFEEQYMQRNGQNFNLIGTAWIFWNDEYDFENAHELEFRVKEELYSRYKKSLGDNIIELMHTTDYSRKYRAFYDGYYIVPEDWIIGTHVVTYMDGTEIKLPVVYGYNIRTVSDDKSADSASTESKVTGYIEAIGASNPTVCDGRLFYKTAYKNPYPEKTIIGMRCEAKDGVSIEVKYDI